MNTPQHPGEKKTLKTVFIRCQTCLLIGEIYLMCQAGRDKKRERSVRKGGVWWSLCLDHYGIQTEQGHICLLSHTLFLCFFCFTLITIQNCGCGDRMKRGSCPAEYKKKKSKESKKKTFNLHFPNILRGLSDFFKPPFIIISSISSECLCVYTCCK